MIGAGRHSEPAAGFAIESDSVLFGPRELAFEPRDASLGFLHRVESPLEPCHPAHQYSSLFRQLIAAALDLPGSPRIGFDGTGCTQDAATRSAHGQAPSRRFCG